MSNGLRHCLTALYLFNLLTNTERADGGCCLTFNRHLELNRIYAEVKKKKKNIEYPIAHFRSFSVFSRVGSRYTFLPSGVDLASFLEYSDSSAEFVLNMIKILFLQQFNVFFGFVYLFAIYKHQSG